ncbi:MAG: S8 family serine peptidase [Myxococcaceae bacterium]|nr:S8 family serine peptidase [Myxococcaceae bacterium]
MKVRTAPITEVMAKVIAGRRLDEQTWSKELKPLLDGLPHRSGFEIRRLVAVWASDSIEIDPAVRSDVKKTLSDFGYLNSERSTLGDPRDRAPGTPSSRFRTLEARNVTSPSRTFEKLRALVAPESAEVTVAVLDTAIDLNHPVLAAALSPAFASVEESLSRRAPSRPAGLVDSHGAHVAGIASQRTDRVKLLPEPLIDGTGQLIAPEATIDEVVRAGARVVNLSLATNTAEEVAVLERAILAHPETLFVLGAGNKHLALGEGDFSPQTHLAARDYPNLEVVTSARSDGVIAWSAATGADIAARGDGVLSTVMLPAGRQRAEAEAGYDVMSGTSMATPQVASAAARCLVLDPSLTPVELRRVLSVSCDVSENWDALVSSGGTLNDERACAVVAARVLVSRGETPAAAVARLPVPASEKPKILQALEQLSA